MHLFIKSSENRTKLSLRTYAAKTANTNIEIKKV